jgi:SAM-dependent methyltransferase
MSNGRHNEDDYIQNHWWFASRTRALQALMRPLLPATAEARLLDVGCGAGNMIDHLSAYGRVKGLEIDPRPVKVAHQRGYDVEQFDATQPLPFAAGTFEAICSCSISSRLQVRPPTTQRRSLQRLAAGISLMDSSG